MQHRRFGSTVALVPLLALLAVAPAPAWAQASNPTTEVAKTQVGGVTFSLGAGFGQVGGTAYERVYAPWVRDFKVSELKWDISNVAMAGFQGQVGFANRFRVNLGYQFAVSEGDGDMVDRDWLLVNSYAEDQWTHESRHPDTALDSGSVLDLNLDFKAFSRGTFALSGIVGYRRNEWEWSARGGSYTYSYDRNEDGYYTPDEIRAYQGTFPEGRLVIAYRQEYEMPYLGLGCEGAWGPVQVQGHLLYSPWVSAADDDYHALRSQTFTGDYSGGDWFGADVSARWFFLRQWYATMSLEYQKFDEVIGDVKTYGREGSDVYRDSGGMELETVMLFLGAGLRF